jgi:hypothetical protein
MNCPECQELVQRYLDGEPVSSDRGDFATHLVLCADCRDHYAAAQCLLDGLSVLSPSRPPADLLERICRHIMAERARARLFRRLLVGSALAASLLVTCWAVYSASRFVSKDDTRVQSAGVALTRRTAEATVNRKKLLLLIGIPEASFGDAAELEQVLEPPAESFREIQEAMSAGLEPVATSARQVVGLFLREIPPIESGSADD